MGPAVALGNVVREGEHVLVVGIVPPQRDFDRHAITLALDEDRGRGQRRLGAIEIAHEGLETALIEKLLALDLGAARVSELDPDPGIQEGEFAQPVLDRREIEVEHREGFGRRQESDFRAALHLAVFDRRRTYDRERGDDIAIGEIDHVFLAVAPDAQPQEDRECVDHGDADAVQTARDLVGILVELSARVQLGHDDLRGGDTFLGVDIGRNAAPVVGDGHGAIRIEGHRDLGRIARQRLVDRIVDHLIDHVMQAGPIIRVADIHAGPLAHGIEATQDLDRIGAVGILLWQQHISAIIGGGIRLGGSSLSHESANFLC